MRRSARTRAEQPLRTIGSPSTTTARGRYCTSIGRVAVEASAGSFYGITLPGAAAMSAAHALVAPTNEVNPGKYAHRLRAVTMFP